MAEARAAAGEPEVGGYDEIASPFGVHLIETAKDRIAGHADQDQSVALFDRSAQTVLGLVFHLLDQIPEVVLPDLGPPEAVAHTEKGGPVGEGVENRRAAPIQLEHALERPIHGVGIAHVFAQTVDVEGHATHLLTQFN